MNLYTGDLGKIEKEIRKLELELNTEEDKDRIIGIVSSIELLLELYKDVNDKVPKNLKTYAKTNRDKTKLSDKLQLEVANEFEENFIRNKKFHALFANNLYCNLSSLESQLLSIDKGYKLTDKDMYDIMMDYLIEENLEKEFTTLLKEKLLFIGKSNENYTGYAVHNTIHNKGHIYLCNVDDSIRKMTTLIHEFGHVLDYINLKNTQGFKVGNDYYLKSIYTEVSSRLLEKNFLSYLLEKDICSEDVCARVEDYYLATIDMLSNLTILSSLDEKSIRNQRYLKLNKKRLVKNAIKNNEQVKNIDLDLVSNDITVYNSLIYGYGGVLAAYYNYLKRNDSDKYEFYHSKFLEKRADFFNISTFSDMFSNYNELERDVLKELSNDIKIKQKVYHEK